MSKKKHEWTRKGVTASMAVVLAFGMVPAVPGVALAGEGLSDAPSERITSTIEVSTEQELINAVESATSGLAISLKNNIQLESTLAIPSGKSVMIDLAGYTLSTLGTKDVIDNSGILLVKNGTVACEDKGKDSYGMAVDNLSGGRLTVEQDAGCITKLIGRSGIQNYGEVIVNEGTVESYNRNAYWGSDTSSLIVNNGTFTSPMGNSGMGRAISSNGNVYIYGGYFYAGGYSGAGDSFVNAIGMYEQSELVIRPEDGKTVNVVSATDYAVASSGKSVEIFGGNFACNGERTDVYRFNSAEVRIHGGVFRHEPYEEYLADCCVVTEGDLGYVVDETEQATDVEVRSFDELKKALSGSIFEPKNVKILKDVTIPSANELTLQRGYTLSIEDGATLSVDGILSLDGQMANYGVLSVGDRGYIENPLKLVNEGEIEGYPSVENGVCTISTPMQLQWVSYMVERDDDNIPSEIRLVNDICIPEGVLFEASIVCVTRG